MCSPAQRINQKQIKSSGFWRELCCQREPVYQLKSKNDPLAPPIWKQWEERAAPFQVQQILYPPYHKELRKIKGRTPQSKEPEPLKTMNKKVESGPNQKTFCPTKVSQYLS